MSSCVTMIETCSSVQNHHPLVYILTMGISCISILPLHSLVVISFFKFRSTPVESLHTILLGPYKYLLKITIPKLSKKQKDEVLARIRAFNFSGFRVKLHGNVIRHHQSFVGRDYKAWAQMAPFIIFPYLTNGIQMVWLSLSKVWV